MLIEALQRTSLYKLLFQIDQELAERKKAARCPFCGSVLHAANYPRKPRGGPDNLSKDLLYRHSFCCSAENCRKRVLPLSCRFWGRKVYWSVAILVIMTLKQGRTSGYSAGKLIRLFGISRLTLKRWITYFKTAFLMSTEWRRIRGRFAAEVADGQIPSALVLFFVKKEGRPEKGLILSARLFSGAFDMI